MEPSTFRARLVAARGNAEEPFVAFDEATLRASGLDKDTIRFLVEAGLPRSGVFFGSFDALDADAVETWRGAGLPSRYFPIGGSFVIDLETSKVMEVSTDWARVWLVNSSVALFAESLCLFEEHAEGEHWSTLVRRVGEIDAPAAQPDCFWPRLAEDAQVLDEL